ncbi:16611_t:CDS:1, partial [Gigaspora margarita]
SLTEEDEVLGGNKVIVEIDKFKFEDYGLWELQKEMEIRNVIL